MFRELNYFLSMSNAEARVRRHLVQQVTASQMDAITEIMRRLAERTINIYQRDIPFLEDDRLVIRTIASNRVSRRRKKNVLLRHHSLLARVLRPHYIYQTIAAELGDFIRTGEE